MHGEQAALSNGGLTFLKSPASSDAVASFVSCCKAATCSLTPILCAGIRGCSCWRWACLCCTVSTSMLGIAWQGLRCDRTARAAMHAEVCMSSTLAAFGQSGPTSLCFGSGLNCTGWPVSSCMTRLDLIY